MKARWCGHERCWSGTILTRSTPLCSAPGLQADEKPLEVPENAVSCPITGRQKGPRKGRNLSLYTPVIVKYRDEKTDRGSN
jgi:2,3,4,5-tetrahydropyridine-2-carboxylate N-succinyltransferase